MINKSVKRFYMRFLFNIYELLSDELFPLDIAETFFNNLIPNFC